MIEGASDVTSEAQGHIPADELAQLLLQSTGDGIYGVDVAGNCTFANPACVRLLGFSSEEELLGKQMHKLVHHTRPDGSPYRHGIGLVQHRSAGESRDNRAIQECVAAR